MLSRYEQVRHVELNSSATAGVCVDQSEARQPFPHTDQQGVKSANPPVALKVGKRGIAILTVEVGGTGRLHPYELVDIELYEALD
jgi:hypothetical protein